MSALLNVAGIVEESIVDGPGVRFVIFVQGCIHRCEGCHNPQTHPFGVGEDLSVDALYEQICGNTLIRGVTFSGGEPFCQAAPLSLLGERLLAAGYDVVVYSGYTLETLLELSKTDPCVHDLLSVTSYLVDGPYLEAERDLTLAFRGSRNQKIYDLRDYRRTGKIQEISSF